MSIYEKIREICHQILGFDQYTLKEHMPLVSKYCRYNRKIAISNLKRNFREENNLFFKKLFS